MSEKPVMKFAAFFRNLNLGRTNCPDRARFEAAFLAAGAASAQSFLTNGTMVFASPGVAKARRVLADASAMLQRQCGLQEPAFLREVVYLAELVASAPFAQIDRSSVYECCVTFLHPRASLPAAAPRESARGEVAIVLTTGHEVLSISRKLGKTPGSPNAFLERLIGMPATTRAWNTVVRLVQKHA